MFSSDSEISDSSSSGSMDSMDNEPLRRYKPGGYHPVSIGEVFNNRYRVIKKMGWGTFSTVWSAYDYQEPTIFKVLKIQKADKSSTMNAQEEIKYTSEIKDEYGCSLLDNFQHIGIFGKHEVLVFRLLGENLLKVLDMYQFNGLPLNIVKKISKQLLQCLIHLSEDVKLIHTDIKPENILVTKPSKSIMKELVMYKPPAITEGVKLADRNRFTMTQAQKKRVKRAVARRKRKKEDESESEEDEDEYLLRITDVRLVDFGNSQYIDKVEDYEIQTRYYRSPEVIFNANYNETSDIWSFGCTVYELLTGECLFNPKKGKFYGCNDDHIASIMEVIDTDLSCYKESEVYQDYFKDDQLQYISNVKPISLKKILIRNHYFTRVDATEWSEFIMSMLAIDYRKRPSARYMLKTFGGWLDS